MDAPGTDPRRLARMAHGVLEINWQPSFGYAAPAPGRYPWHWLWDSCFHAVCWAALGDERAVPELRSVFAHQGADGFVPHMGYQRDPRAAVGVWGRAGCSTITQPPMYGHAVRVLAEAGLPVGDLAERAAAGLRYFAARRRGARGLVRIVHPWESGADDSVRWDGWAGGPFDRTRWMQVKLGLVRSLEVSAAGSAVANASFTVHPASFNALVAFNARELVTVTGDRDLAGFADELAGELGELWDPQAGTWPDVDDHGRAASAAPTLDGLLPLLVTDPGAGGPIDAVVRRLADERWFRAPFGLAAVARDDPAFDACGYGRGASWPHLNYLIWLALERHGRRAAAREVAGAWTAGAVASGFSEFVDPLSGRGLGACPQSWASLVVVPYCQPSRTVTAALARPAP